MTLAGTVEQAKARAATAKPAGFVASVALDYSQVANLWEQMAEQGAALPFQRRNWLGPWYAAHRAENFQPLLVTVADTQAGASVMALPLVRCREGGLQVIAFADAGLTDYNAPILGAAAPRDATGAQGIIKAIRAALPMADVLHFGKMPVMVGHLPNPLALLPHSRASTLAGNILHMPGAWEDWHRGLERTFRKELERSLRVFLKHDGAQFRRFTERAEIARIYAQLKIQQRERIGELGLPYILDQPESEAFYDQLVAEGGAILTALTVGEEVIAALLGIAEGEHYAMVRLSTAGAKWKTCSPGRLLIERTMQMLHGEGFHMFDFTIGDYAYKRRMGVSPLELREMTLALSWRGWPVVAKERLKTVIRSRPQLRALAKRLLAISNQK